MDRLNALGALTAGEIPAIAAGYGTPLYLYDEAALIGRCRAARSMPNAYGLTVRYAMKAGANRALLRVIRGEGIQIDASSLMEARRAHLAGYPYEEIILTTQEIPEGGDRHDLEAMMLRGLRYNVCSLRQLSLIAAFAARHDLSLAIRVHPGVGSGETATRNTGDAYSCFGVHRADLAEASRIASEHGASFALVHAHIGSGADPEVWRENIDRQLDILGAWFPDAHTVSLGGGLREARMPEERAADIALLGAYAKERIEAFYRRTGRKLHMEIEPGTYIMANAGYIVTRVLDVKTTRPEGYDFAILDGGMELNARPLMYGSRHPFYVIGHDGALRSSEFGAASARDSEIVVVGCCCESGDSQCLDPLGNPEPRLMARPRIGDFILIGGAGAYCASMAPFNYNAHPQAPEALRRTDGSVMAIRRRQTLEEMLSTEL